MTGTQIGNYKILEKLGEGGMGVVYKAMDINLERTVAIKALNTELTGNPELEKRFRAEARAQANLNHTNLATLYALLIEDGRPWMVMEYIEGETFEQMVQRRGPIPATDSVPIFRQALLGIGYAHRMGVVHRDIKPSNIMVNKQGIVKVMDFGIAKVLGSRGMTKTGTQMGTAFYMSPEQVLNRGVDIRSDIYSLGVTLYEMLTANVPFNGDSDYQVMTDHVNAVPPLPTKFYPYIPLGLQNAVLKALEKTPDARFQTVEEFGMALEQPDTFGVAPKTDPAPRAATIVERGMSVPAAVPPAAAPTPKVAPPAPPAARAVPPVPPVGPPPVVPNPVVAPPGPAKTSFFTPERKIAFGSLAIIVFLVAGWLALKPKVKNTGLAPQHSSIEPSQIPQPAPMQPENPAPAPKQPAPAKQEKQEKQEQPEKPEKKEPAESSIPPLPPVRPENPPPSTPVPSQVSALPIPAGSQVVIRLIDNINSIRDRSGQRFAAVVDAPLMINGRLAIARGANARVVLNTYGPQVRLELVSISINGVDRVVRSNEFQKQGMVNGKPSPLVIIPTNTRIQFTLRTPIS